MSIQTKYFKKQPAVYWDTLNIEYPIRKFPETEISRETVARACRISPEVLAKTQKEPNKDIYCRDYTIDKELKRSQTDIDFGYKLSQTTTFNKHTPCSQNEYVYSPSRKLTDNPPFCGAFGTTEMRSNYTQPAIGHRLVREKDQFQTLYSVDQPLLEPSFHKELNPLDTTYDGFEKYLDPYLTTNRLHHRPFTADQLNKTSASKDIVTYYTLANIPWVRTPKPSNNLQFVNRQNTNYKKERINDNFREIRTHNKSIWVPRTFRTEIRDNYRSPFAQTEGPIYNYEDDVKTLYKRFTANLPTNDESEASIISKSYTTENSHIGTGKSLSCILNQYSEKNKRLK